MAYVWIGVGGALGSMARHAVGLWVLAWLGPNFPWGTLLINIIGSVVIGAVATATPMNQDLKLFLAVGLCGGFTTFSAFSLQTLNLIQAGAWMPAALYIAGSVVLCVIGVWLGAMSGGLLAR